MLFAKHFFLVCIKQTHSRRLKKKPNHQATHQREKAAENLLQAKGLVLLNLFATSGHF